METYEEKYKDLVKRLNKAREEKGVYTFNSVLDVVAPELRIDESEDDRIRKGLIEACKQSLIVGGFHKDKVISWLKKQKEPKYLDTSTCEPWSDEQTRRNLINFLKSLGATEIPQASYNRYLSYLERQGEY